MDRGKVVLVNTNEMRPPVAPIGLDYLGACLLAHGWEVELIDLALAGDAEDALRGGLAGGAPVAVGVTARNTDDCYFASRHSCLPRLAEIVKLIKQHTDAPIILGGAGFSVMPTAVLDRLDVELGIWGEGEDAFPRLLEAISGGALLPRVPGLVWRGGGGPLKTRAPFADLRRLPLSGRGLLDNAAYFRQGGQGGFETKRGCDQPCIYCADPVSKGRTIRTRPPASVADEIESLLTQGVTHLHTCDSEFNIPADHAKAVCRELISRGLGERVAWYAYCAPAPFDAELADLMRRAGCVGIDFGVDSGCEAMLRTYGRAFVREDIAATAALCRENGMVFMFDLLLGGPGETRSTLADTVELMKQADPDRVGVSMGVRLYPGTALAGRLKREGAATEADGIFGRIEGNLELSEPVFYVSPSLGREAHDIVEDLIGDDDRFLFANPRRVGRNYNYNENRALVEAIEAGHRGAFWDILRRTAEGAA
jgi:radical SAM superfamily enzyme YgiQ (UPF0313 family)